MQLLMVERDFSALNQVRIGQIIAKKEDILDKKIYQVSTQSLSEYLFWTGFTGWTGLISIL